MDSQPTRGRARTEGAGAGGHDQAGTFPAACVHFRNGCLVLGDDRVTLRRKSFDFLRPLPSANWATVRLDRGAKSEG